MADNIVVSDANDVDRTLRTTDSADIHTPHHIVASSALPTLASTSTLQDTINTSIAAGNTSLATLAGAVSGTEFRVDIIDEGSVANATNQATANGHLSTIAGDTTSLDSKVTACNTGAVVLAAGTNAVGTVKLGAGTGAEIGKLAAGTASIGTVVLGAGTAGIGKLTANSGVDIGDVDVTSVAIPSTIYHGQETVDAAGTDQTIRAAGSQAITSGVTVKALAGNTGIIYVGAENVAAATGFELSAKESVFIEVADIASVWIDAATTDDGVSWIAS